MVFSKCFFPSQRWDFLGCLSKNVEVGHCSGNTSFHEDLVFFENTPFEFRPNTFL